MLKDKLEQLKQTEKDSRSPFAHGMQQLAAYAAVSGDCIGIITELEARLATASAAFDNIASLTNDNDSTANSYAWNGLAACNLEIPFDAKDLQP